MDVRVSDADREQMMQALQEGMSQGYLTTAEFSERVDRALLARTRRELRAVAEDLPFSGTGDHIDVPQPAGDVVELRSTLSSIKRKGQWAVPRKLVLKARWGSSDLDFTEARIDHPVIEVQVDVQVGSVELRLPEGASASLDAVSVTLGSTEDHRRPPRRSGGPHFVLTGRIVLGSLELRGPRRKWFG